MVAYSLGFASEIQPAACQSRRPATQQCWFRSLYGKAMAVRHTSIEKLKVLSGAFLFQNWDNILTHLDDEKPDRHKY